MGFVKKHATEIVVILVAVVITGAIFLAPVIKKEFSDAFENQGHKSLVEQALEEPEIEVPVLK